MKTTFIVYGASETLDAKGRPALEKGDEIEVSRLEVRAYIPKTPQHTPLTAFHFWLANGEQYEMILAGGVLPIPKKDG